MDNERILYLQIEPQHSWHGEAVIRGDKAALLHLAAVLTDAAESKELSTGTVFAGDGEGYHVLVQRVERPSDLPAPFYVCENEYHDYGGPGHNKFCGKCGREKPPRKVPAGAGDSQ